MPIFTLGHSNHTVEKFFELLSPHCITHIVDVRSRPYSRHVPDFNRENFQSVSTGRGLVYEWWGESLGGFRSDEPGAGATSDSVFKKSIENLAEKFGESSGKVAVIVCAEGDPRKCHRSRLIGPALRGLQPLGIDLQHILPDGTLMAQSELEERSEAPSADRSGTLSLFDM
jgi:uncharacterized protein (DUF488 family)